MNIDKSARNTTTTKSYKKSVVLTSLLQESDDTSVAESSARLSTLALASPSSPSEAKYSVLKIPFIGRAPMKTVCVPRAIVEPEPPTVKTAKTVLCSYKVT